MDCADCDLKIEKAVSKYEKFMRYRVMQKGQQLCYISALVCGAEPSWSDTARYQWAFWN